MLSHSIKPTQNQGRDTNANSDQSNHNERTATPKPTSEHPNGADEASRFQGFVGSQELEPSTSPVVGEINLWSFNPELFQPFMGLRDVDRPDDPWHRPHSYHDGNHYHYSTGRIRVRREKPSTSFGSTKKMYLYEIDDYSTWKAKKKWEQIMSVLKEPFNLNAYTGNLFPFPTTRSNSGATTKITIKPPVFNYDKDVDVVDDIISEDSGV